MSIFESETIFFFILLNLVNAHINFAADLRNIAAIVNDFKRLGALKYNDYINRDLNLISPDSANTRAKRTHKSMLVKGRTYFHQIQTQCYP